MELRQLTHFVAVAECLSFARAAEQLGVGQSSVSQHVARLERELGVVLLHRSSRVVRLSEAGERFLPEARAVLAAADRALAAAAGDPLAGGVLRLGTSTGLGDRLDVLLESMRTSAPELAVELVSTSTQVRLDRVRSGQLDAAFVRGLVESPGLDIEPVWQEPLVVALPATHPRAGDDAVELTELGELPLRLVPRNLNTPLVDLVLTACASVGFEPRRATGPMALQDTLAAIGNGTAWTVLYAAQARTLRRDRVAFRPVRQPELVMTTALAMPAGAGSRALAPLLRACVEIARSDARS